MGEDEAARVKRVPSSNLSDRQCNNSRNVKSNIDIDASRLDLRHQSAGKGAAEAMNNDKANVNGINNSTRGGPFSFAADGDTREDHKSEGVYRCASQRRGHLCAELHSQSTEHMTPIRPSVLLYPIKKLKELFHFSPAK
jgi:hypothetical protein